MLVQIVVELGLQKIDDEVAHRRPVGSHILRSELRLGLRLEHRLLDLDADRRDDRRADVRRIEILAVELLDRLGDRLPERGLMRPALRRVLSVDERIVRLAVAVPVRDRHLDVGPRQVNRRIERLLAQILVEQIQQAVARHEGLPVDADRQPGVQVGVVADHRLDVLHVVGVLAEYAPVGHERHARAVAVADAALGRVRYLLAGLETHGARLAVADAADRELARQRVDGFDTDAVQADGLLEGLRVILGSGVHLRGDVHELAERNAAPVVAHRHAAVVPDRDVDRLAETHHVLVNRVVEHLLDQDVYAVVGRRAVAELSDVHARAPADMLLPVERPDMLVAVVCCCVHVRSFLRMRDLPAL